MADHRKPFVTVIRCHSMSITESYKTHLGISSWAYSRRQRKEDELGWFAFFQASETHFEAADYIDLIDWSNCVVTEPPLTMHLKNKDWKEMCKEEQLPILTFEEFPCHTQSVERCVKLISEAEMKVFW
ncbi:hypothetical protein AVEN_84666-1 [Araneus ventricosus]|uniref:Uncharacterized protein n=1 Tax=Araneus ventricosus TaxID=182803 RepID=A0A4Y2N8G9_ARAVE|nr:hypothetical protein AVEN_73334-1 [Araneus ventricosus]GBN35202.1 hypothetical protein AVEN_84666-1 [Araneus ventricosus]